MICASCGTIGYKNKVSEARKYAVKHDHGYMLMVHDTKAGLGMYCTWEIVKRKLIAVQKIGAVFGDIIPMIEVPNPD